MQNNQARGSDDVCTDLPNGVNPVRIFSLGIFSGIYIELNCREGYCVEF